MYKKENAIELIKQLKKYYPDATCSLDFTTPFELLVATILSAQCTDERVNKTTPSLFNKYNTPLALANINIEELEKIIHPCGFYKNKAKNIKECANQLVLKYNSEVPKNPEDLIKLPGVGRKTANVVLLEAFGIANGIAVDTHAKRISTLIGLSSKTTPDKIEQDLLKIFPKEYFKDVNHLFVWHGRNICIANKPQCNICPINSYCNYYKNK